MGPERSGPSPISSGCCLWERADCRRLGVVAPTGLSHRLPPDLRTIGDNAMRRFCAALDRDGAMLLAAPALADEWPSRPVRMVNTFAAGGTADVLTRLVAEHLSGVLKQQFFVETRAGAAGTIGVKSVADSAARRLQLRAHQHHPSGAGADQQSQARLRSAARPHQHRLCRGLADHDLGQRQERHQVAEGFRRARQDERQGR